MNPVKFFKRRLMRESFATVLPLAAFFFGLTLALLFTAIYFSRSYSQHADHTKAFATVVAAQISEDVAAGDLAGLDETLALMAPMRAEITDLEGNRIAGSLRPDIPGKDAVIDLGVDGAPFCFITLETA